MLGCYIIYILICRARVSFLKMELRAFVGLTLSKKRGIIELETVLEIAK